MSSSVKWVPEDTPYLVIDSAKMERNILKLANLAKGSGVALRPHVKTQGTSHSEEAGGSGGRGDHGGEGL
jgi:D-serine deaminase-like pyridoxal phosphate-dependent protein